MKLDGSALEAISRGRHFFSGAIGEVLLEDYMRQLKQKGLNDTYELLTDREKEVLQLLKREKYPIRAYVEYEHRGTAGAVEEVKGCFEYAKRALA